MGSAFIVLEKVIKIKYTYIKESRTQVCTTRSAWFRQKVYSVTSDLGLDASKIKKNDYYHGKCRA